MQSRMFKALYIALLVVILFSHALLSEGSSRQMLERPKELPIKTITIDDGDIYDCVKLDSQPSSRRGPSIERKTQSRAKFPLNGATIATNDSHESTSEKMRETGVLERSETCPAGSVPVLKATKAGPLNLSALEEFASSRARSLLKSKIAEPLRNNDAHHEYALGFVMGRYGGGEGTLSVWEPELEVTTEMSLSQIWVLHEGSNGIRMALESGWMANPSVFGDARSRFFIFTTNDSYNTYLYNDNLRKPRSGNNLQFRRTSEHMPFGKQLQPSTLEGQTSEMKITIKQNDDEDWEIFVDDEEIGYWPGSNYRVTSANKVQWGGEIVNRRITGRHTSTQMGSGHFSTEPIGRVAYIRQLGLYDLDDNLYNAPEDIDVVIDNPDCYDLTYWNYDEDEDEDEEEDENEFKQFMTFGGPGFDPEECP